MPDIWNIINKRCYVIGVDSLTREGIPTSSQDLQYNALDTMVEKQRGPQRHRGEAYDLPMGSEKASWRNDVYPKTSH